MNMMIGAKKVQKMRKVVQSSVQDYSYDVKDFTSSPEREEIHLKAHDNQGLPPFLLNSIPKSGTHLLKQLLLGIPGMKHDPNKGMFGHMHYQTEAKLDAMDNLTNHEFVNGHLYYTSEWETFFNKRNMKQIFVYRDPRDVVVSYAYFIPTLKIHPLYDTFTQENFTHRDRIKFLIQGGHPTEKKWGYQHDVAEWFKSFSAWMSKPEVFSVRFEDLTSSDKSRIQAVHRIVKFLWGENPVPSTRPLIVWKMIQNINPQTSPTFRKGKIGGWRNEFDDELKALFKQKAGQLLVDLDYEKDENW